MTELEKVKLLKADNTQVSTNDLGWKECMGREEEKEEKERGRVHFLLGRRNTPHTLCTGQGVQPMGEE